MYVETYETSSLSQIILFSNMRFIVMFVTAVCVLFLIKDVRAQNFRRTDFFENLTAGRK